MVKEPGRLTVRGIAALKNPGRHADGGNLYVLVGRDGKSKHFVFMYRFGKRQREAGLGPTAKVTLAQARREAAEWREMLRQGIDPLAAKKAAIEAARAAASKATFGEVADDLLRVRRGGWGARHAREWRQTMVEHAAPLWTMPVDEVDTDAIVKALKPVWSVTPDVGRRVRQRVEGVLAAAQARGLTPPDRANPARWRGLIENLLPRPPTLPRGHYRSMPYGAVPGFFAELRAQDAAPARALAFIILTAARINEAIAAEWSEIDIAGRSLDHPGE